MALNIADTYPGQIEVVAGSHPFGKAVNVSAPDAGDGTPLEKVWLNEIWGFMAALLAKEGDVPDGVPEGKQYSQYYDAVTKATFKAYYEHPSGMSHLVSTLLAQQGILCVSATDVQTANDYLKAANKRGTIYLPEYAVIGVDVPITVDMDFVSIEGRGAKFLATGLGATESCFILVSDSLPLNGAAPSTIKNFSLDGLAGGIDGNRKGFDIRNSGNGSNGPSALIIENVNVKDFQYGIWSDDEKFDTTLVNVGIYECAAGIRVESTTGAGVIEMRGGIVEECYVALSHSSSNRNVQFFGTKMIENLKLIAMTGTDGTADLHGCVMKAQDYPNIPITVSGAGSGVNIFGGRLELLTIDSASFSRWADIGTDCFMNVIGTKMVNTRTGNGNFASGDGAVRLQNTQYDPASINHTLLHDTRSMVSDPGFESTSIQDDVFILASDAAIDDRYDVGGTRIYPSTLEKHSGTRSLAYTKDGNTSDNSEFSLALIPVRPFDRVGFEVWWRKPADAMVGGSFSFKIRFVTMGVNEFGVPVIITEGLTTQFLQTVTVADSGWTLFDPDGPWVAPEWATHFMIEVYGSGWNSAGSTIYFDDMNINIIG